MTDAYKTDHPLNGVTCEVTDCKYNQFGENCTASSINVTTSSSAAQGATKTDCATFCEGRK